MRAARPTRGYLVIGVLAGALLGWIAHWIPFHVPVLPSEVEVPARARTEASRVAEARRLRVFVLGGSILGLACGVALDAWAARARRCHAVVQRALVRRAPDLLSLPGGDAQTVPDARGGADDGTNHEAARPLSEESG